MDQLARQGHYAIVGLLAESYQEKPVTLRPHRRFGRAVSKPDTREKVMLNRRYRISLINLNLKLMVAGLP